ncbi:TetR/AcrR family transcriptional regulator [Reyranella sp.]|uniref:TetR/AcrR family transcriptional regulator n=1 Tax=Reyranella sp. TaxID=1929291 RepID=UPI0037848C89
MPKDKSKTDRRIVEAAYYLFYRRGFTRVGVDEIAARAGITKRTLYSHFRSKDDLLAAALTRHHELDLERLQSFARHLPEDPEAMVESFFDQLLEWAATPRWSGSGFTRLAVELADLPGHPARAIAARAKGVTESWLTSLLAKGGVASAAEMARAIMLLMEGAMALMLIHGDRTYGRSAAGIAGALVSAAASPAGDRAGSGRRANAGPSRRRR